MNSFESEIKDWVLLDNKIKVLNENIKILREKRNNVSNNILESVQTNKLSNTIVNISDGKIKFTSTKHQKPITFKYVEDCLHYCIKNEEQVKIIMNYIKNSREIQIVPEIKRTYTN